MTFWTESRKKQSCILVNALAFDTEWQAVYQENQVRDGIFTTEDGIEREIELMRSEEHNYFEAEMATGFLKYYDDLSYAFVALLPKEGLNGEEYVASLNGGHLHTLLSSPSKDTVNTAIPKFEMGFSTELSDILAGIGMPDAFDWRVANFSGIGSFSDHVSIVIKQVIHRTFIAVDQKGTKAGTATVVKMAHEGAAMPSEEPKTVILDRPFVYMLIDCENNLPSFIEAVMDIEG